MLARSITRPRNVTHTNRSKALRANTSGEKKLKPSCANYNLRDIEFDMNVLHYEIHDHVAVVTLNRPEARNSLNPDLIVALAEVWEQIKEDQQVRVAVITGAGESTFCSGFDLERLSL